jgi:hypothetical protein
MGENSHNRSWQKWQAVFDADPDTARIVLYELLSGDAPIPREARDKLAELFNNKSPSRLVAEVKNRRRGKPKANANPSHHNDVCDYVTKLQMKGEQWEPAVAAASAHFGMSRTAITDILAEGPKTGMFFWFETKLEKNSG